MRAVAALALAAGVAGHGHGHRTDRGFGAVTAAVRAAPAHAAVPFKLSDVKLDPASAFGIARQRNLEYAIGLNTDQLTCIFTAAANLTECESCPSKGRAGRPVCSNLPGEMGLGAYYGHYLGHWLSATAFLHNSTGDPRPRNVSRTVVQTLKRCQDAWGAKYGARHEGYLFPFDPVVFDMLEEKLPWGSVAGRREYSVPFYTLHKIMAGMLDQHTNAGNDVALTVVLGMADWVVRNVDETLSRGGQGLWQRVLGTEWGGMNEVMFNLYALVGDERYLKTAYAFNHWSWSAPLAAGVDDLDGNHANTHIPEVIGNQRGYELTGNETDKAVALQFFSAVTQNHSWATGGSNDHEHWGAARRMGDQLNADTEESCTQYNVLKVARHLFQWTADSAMFDFYERAILNGILGNQNKEDVMTKYIYMLPLGGGGVKKPWGWSDQSFPCCWGTLTEQFGKIADSIYFATPDHSGVYVTQFVSSSVHWRERNVTVAQVAGFPASQESTTRITITGTSSRFSLYIRVPAWATGNNSADVNGSPVAVTPGQMLELSRAWQSGDVVTVHFPMPFSAKRLNDDRPQWNATYAFMYGPLVLTGLTSSATLVPPPGHSAENPGAFITRNSSTALDFVATGSHGLVPTQVKMRMRPLLDITDEAYTVYFDTRGESAVPYKRGGAAVPSTQADIRLSGGMASFNTGPRDPLCDGENIRTGNPGEVTEATLAHPIVGTGHSITAVSMKYRYSAGYTPAAGESKKASVLSFLIEDAVTGDTWNLYTSPPLGNYSYDKFVGYSPVIPVSATGLSIPNTNPLLLKMRFSNQERNLQLPIDDLSSCFNVLVRWDEPAADALPFTHGRGVWWGRE